MSDETQAQSDERRVEAELQESEERVRLLLNSTGEGIYGVDLNGNCTFANPACLKLLGFDSDTELLGRTMHNLVHHTRPNGDPYPMEECRIYTAFREGRGVHVDDEVMWRADGSSFPAEYWSYPMKRDGKPVGSVLTFVDITERRRVEAALERAMDQAKEANEAKSRFLANMSHELRTPMNAILGYSEMLIEDAEDEGNSEIVPDLQKINAAGKHLLALINDVLDLSKIEAGRMDLYLENFDLLPMLEEVVVTAEPLVVKNDSVLVTHFDDSLGQIHADLTKVRQSLFNLLSNAAKFTQDGTVTLDARREDRSGRDWILLAVSDTGIGIPEDKFGQVFEEFAQADASTTRDYGGTGLGLALTRRLCRMMGGEITLESEVGSGSTFTIELPARVQELPADEAEVDTTPPSEVPAHPILIIDDDANTRELLTRTLERDGYAVVTAAGGKEGLGLAKRLQPSLITLDILMPEMDGWSVLRALKADPELCDIPVVMLSIAPEREIGYSLGAVESLTKPVDRKVLREVVGRYQTADGGHVLIVEDDDDVRAMLRRSVEKQGWEAAEADTGAAALDRVEERRPDLILLDLMMPVMGGFEFVDELRRSAEYRTIPIVVITAKDLTGEDRARLKGNVEHIVEKGGRTANELLHQVRDLLTPGGRRQ